MLELELRIVQKKREKMESETKLTGRLVKVLRQMQGCVLNIHGSALQQEGWPDVYVSHSLWFGFLEFKVKDRKLSSSQKYVGNHLRKCRQPAWVIRIANQLFDVWVIVIEDFNAKVFQTLTLKGTDGQVAAGLLKELRRLEEI